MFNNMKNKPKITCLSIDCPERFSLCCGQRCTNGDEGIGEPHFVCKGCRHEFVGGECRHARDKYKEVDERFDNLDITFVTSLERIKTIDFFHSELSAQAKKIDKEIDELVGIDIGYKDGSHEQPLLTREEVKSLLTKYI